MSTTSLKRQEEVLPMAKQEQRRYNLLNGALHIGARFSSVGGKILRDF